MPKTAAEVTPELIARATKLRKDGKSYKEVAKALNLASEKVAWHVVNTHGKGAGKASGKASTRSKAPGKAKVQPKARKASSGSVASPRGPKKASGKAAKAPTAPTAPAKAPTASPTDTSTVDVGKRLNMLDANGGDRPVARPTAIRPVPKPKDKAKAK